MHYVAGCALRIETVRYALGSALRIGQAQPLLKYIGATHWLSVAFIKMHRHYASGHALRIDTVCYTLIPASHLCAQIVSNRLQSCK